jgi:flagellar basal-body rod protein FlgC
MSSVSAIALSGMQTAMLRLTASARNIANMRSNGPLPGASNAGDFPAAYTPVQAVQNWAWGGGTAARLVPMLGGPLPFYDPSAPFADSEGMVAAPNIDLGAEIVNLITARNDYAANLMVLRVEADMMDRLLDIRA